MAEYIIGGVLSGHLARGPLRGYGLYVTSDRIIGVKGGWKQLFGGILGDALEVRAGVEDAPADTRKAFELIERNKDFEVGKDELESVILRRTDFLWRILSWGVIEVRAPGRTYRIRIGRDGEELVKLRSMLYAFQPDKFVSEAD